MEFFESILIILKILLVPVFLCTACLCIDTYVNVRYFIWNLKEKRAKAECEELANVTQYDANFFDDCK